MNKDTYTKLIAGFSFLASDIRKRLVENAEDLSEEQRADIITELRQCSEDQVKIVEDGVRRATKIAKKVRRLGRERDEEKDRGSEILPSFEIV
jgi:hypothetical protein